MDLHTTFVYSIFIRSRPIEGGRRDFEIGSHRARDDHLGANLWFVDTNGPRSVYILIAVEYVNPFLECWRFPKISKLDHVAHAMRTQESDYSLVHGQQLPMLHISYRSSWNSLDRYRIQSRNFAGLENHGRWPYVWKSDECMTANVENSDIHFTDRTTKCQNSVLRGAPITSV